MFNTSFQEVFNHLLSMITNYDYLEYTEEELREEFVMYLKRVMGKWINKDFKADYDMEEFDAGLDDTQIMIIALGLLSEFLYPKIYSITLLKQQLSSKDYSSFSQANHLKELNELKSITDKDFSYWIQRYSLHKFRGGE